MAFPHAQTDWAADLAAAQACFAEILRTIARFQPVWLLCDTVRAPKAWVEDIPSERLRLIEATYNDTWARDFGPIAVQEADGLHWQDYQFNGWGLKFPANLDNQLTAHLHQQGLLPNRRVRGLVLEGGSIDSDGQGSLLTTEACLLSANRNPHLSQSELNLLLSDQLGAQRIHWLRHGYLAGDDTDRHIDTLARFCDARTIAYTTCTEPEDEHFGPLQRMEADLKRFRGGTGEPYRLLPLPLPEAQYHPADGHRLPATYANFLIINGAVLVPTYGCPQDEEALAVLKGSGCFADREIIGVDCRALIRQHGSLHCITMHLPAA